MPDITMCIATGCSIKNSCYRYTAKPDKYQSYSDFSSFCNSFNKSGNKSYSYHLNNKERE